MPDEPNKKVEEQLKAWAQKRRQEVGAPVELHPATRKLLQDEVARTFAKESTERITQSGGLWKMFWLRVALVGSLGVALVAVVGILLPGLARSKSKSQHLAQLREREEISIPASGRRDAPAQTAPGNSARAGDLSVDRLGAEAVQAPAEEARPTRAVPAPAENKPLNQEALVKAQSKDERLKSSELPPKVETRKSPETSNRLELAYSEKAKEAAPPQDQAAIADRGLAPENARSRLLLQRQDLTPKRADTGARAVLEDKQTRNAALQNPALTVPPAAPDVSKVGRSVGGVGGGVATTKAAALNEKPVLFANQNGVVTDAYVLALVREARGATDGIVSPAQQREADQPRGNTNAYYAREPANQIGRQYAQQWKYRVNFNSPALPNVLRSFQVEQTGRQIRVVDADGSVYDGGIELPTTEPLAERSLRVQPDASGLRKSIEPASEPVEGVSGRAVGEAANQRSVFFRVAGTNRTLNQPVVFEGNFLTTTNPTNGLFGGAKLEGDWSAGASSQNRLSQGQRLPNAPIQGQATIGDRNRIQINASPVGP